MSTEYICILIAGSHHKRFSRKTTRTPVAYCELNCCRSLALAAATSEVASAGDRLQAPLRWPPACSREHQRRPETLALPFTTRPGTTVRVTSVDTDDTVPWTRIWSPAHPRPLTRASAFPTLDMFSQHAIRLLTTENCFLSFSLLGNLELVRSLILFYSKMICHIPFSKISAF